MSNTPQPYHDETQRALLREGLYAHPAMHNGKHIVPAEIADRAFKDRDYWKAQYDTSMDKITAAAHRAGWDSGGWRNRGGGSGSGTAASFMLCGLGTEEAVEWIVAHTWMRGCQK